MKKIILYLGKSSANLLSVFCTMILSLFRFNRENNTVYTCPNSPLKTRKAGIMRMIAAFFVVALGLVLSQNSSAQANFSSNVTAGIWTVASTWTITSGTDADGIPDADDTVTILNGHTI